MRVNILTLFALILTFSACKKEQQTFTISGKITSSSNETLYLERMGLDKTDILDSVKLENAGAFSFTNSNGEENPEFYRLRIDDQFIPFIVDSTENITVNGSLSDFGEFYHFEGTEYGLGLQEVENITSYLSERIVRFEKRAHLGAMSYKAMKDSILQEISSAKGELQAKIVVFPQSPVSYYILYKKVFGADLFDINDPSDQKFFGAVATNYEINYPKTKRAEHLKKEFLSALKMRKTAQQSEKKLDQIVANLKATGSFEINLPNNKGELVKLSSTQGNVTLLCFTSLSAEYSAALTVHMGELYQSMSGKPFQIYQVCFDADDNFWRNSAANLPWICVRERAIINSKLIPQYNIQELPTLYLIDKNGDIVRRFDKIEEIKPAVEALL